MAARMTNDQKAMRLLAVLVAGREDLEQPGPGGEVAVFKGETRLNALMFWLRSPDYLAWELLELWKERGARRHVEVASKIIEDEEPILRRDAMAKWRFGAYEPIDDEMARLSSRELVRTVMRPVGPKSAGNDFLLFQRTLDLAASLGGNPAYNWYAERMRLVLEVAEDRSGSALKDRQYQHQDYASTRGHNLIPSIELQVVERLAAIRSGAPHV